jgi:hypothetical protein
VRPGARSIATAFAALAIAASPAAHAATTTPGQSPFAPLPPAQPEVQTTTQPAKTGRPDDSGLSRTVLFGLTLVSLTLIFGVVGLIWYEGRKTGTARKRRKRMRAARVAADPAHGSGGARRGPPPPPRKRRQQARKKRR